MCSYGRTIPTQAGPASSTLCRPCLPACCIMGPAWVCSMALLSDPECTSGVGQGTVSGELTDFPSTAHPRFSPATCQLGCNIATHWCHSTCYRLAISLWPPCSWPLSMVWSRRVLHWCGGRHEMPWHTAGRECFCCGRHLRQQWAGMCSRKGRSLGASCWDASCSNLTLKVMHSI